MVFIGFPHWRKNIEYWLQHNIGKTVVRGINHKLLVPRETLQNLLETTSRRCVLAQGSRSGARVCTSPPSHRLTAGGQGQGDGAQRESLGFMPRSPRRRDKQGNSGGNERRGRRGSGSSAAATAPTGPCCTSWLQLLAQPTGDMSYGHSLASRWIELKLKTTGFSP